MTTVIRRVLRRDTSFDLGIGTDNLLRRQEPSHIKLRFTISNLTNKVALYNFHSTFSGTHFTERALIPVQLGSYFRQVSVHCERRCAAAHVLRSLEQFLSSFRYWTDARCYVLRKMTTA
jgi:hypothetical protein